MAKEIVGYVKLQIKGGQANPAPPVGPALGQRGINIMEFCKAFNEKTKSLMGKPIPVVITVYKDKKFDFVIKSPPASYFIKEAAKLKGGSKEPGRVIVGSITTKQAEKIAQEKMKDLNAFDLKEATKIICGSAKSMGIEVKETIEEAIKMVKKNCTTKFDESIDVSFNLNLKQKKEEFSLRTLVNLPNGNAKKIKLAVLCEDSKVQEAKDAGADLSGADSLVNDIINGKINFDKLVVTPAMMPKMGKLGKILGPKGLMPNPKFGTVTNNIKSIVKAIKSGQIEIKNDKDGNVGASIGKKRFSDIKIKENYNSILETILKEKPSGIKGDFILSAFLTSTMGISYKLKLSK